MHKAIHRQRGFSLLESMISVAITSLAILGVAGLLLKGMSNAKTSNMRTLAALQANSLASAMYSNRAYWAREVPISFSSTGATPQATEGIDLNTNTTCTTTPCAPFTQGSFDAQTWIISVNNLLHEAKTSVACNGTQGSSDSPSDSIRLCKIQIFWKENYIDTSKVKSGMSAATAGEQSYILHVQP